jgi:hypothetical protein
VYLELAGRCRGSDTLSQADEGHADDQEFYQLLEQDGITDDIHLFNEKLREWEDYYMTRTRAGKCRMSVQTARLLAGRGVDAEETRAPSQGSGAAEIIAVKTD